MIYTLYIVYPKNTLEGNKYEIQDDMNILYLKKLIRLHRGKQISFQESKDYHLIILDLTNDAAIHFINSIPVPCSLLYISLYNKQILYSNYYIYGENIKPPPRDLQQKNVYWAAMKCEKFSKPLSLERKEHHPIQHQS
jgi:hypothetical protein